VWKTDRSSWFRFFARMDHAENLLQPPGRAGGAHWASRRRRAWPLRSGRADALASGAAPPQRPCPVAVAVETATEDVRTRSIVPIHGGRPAGCGRPPGRLWAATAISRVARAHALTRRTLWSVDRGLLICKPWAKWLMAHALLYCRQGYHPVPARAGASLDSRPGSGKYR
jgi:hypothetical protein